MLSILIPVYNFDVRTLVAQLHEQCVALELVFEIILYDDLSKPYFQELNKSVAKFSHVNYVRLSKNIGRSSIRNALGSAARFDYLLFMDCDSKVVKSDYIKTYVDHFDPKVILYGGRCYKNEPPAEKEFYFHWQYGKEREEQPAEVRAQKPYHAFMTNNFLIPKKQFVSILFDERIKNYGHEDTLFGMAIRQKNIHIKHLDNPLEHIGLEQGTVFLNKNKSSLRNLFFLIENGIEVETTLLKIFYLTRKVGLHSLILFFAKKREQQYLKRINEQKTKLWEFDLWKLGNLIMIYREHQQ